MPQLDTVVILKVREDPLGWGTHAAQSALSSRAVAADAARLDLVFVNRSFATMISGLSGCQRLVHSGVVCLAKSSRIPGQFTGPSAFAVLTLTVLCSEAGCVTTTAVR